MRRPIMDYSLLPRLYIVERVLSDVPLFFILSWYMPAKPATLMLLKSIILGLCNIRNVTQERCYRLSNSQNDYVRYLRNNHHSCIFVS